MQVRISLRHVRKQEGDSRTVGSHQLVLKSRNNAQGVGADDSSVHSRNYQGAASRRVPDGGVSTKSESLPRPGDTEARGAALSKGTLTGLTPRGGKPKRVILRLNTGGAGREEATGTRSGDGRAWRPGPHRAAEARPGEAVASREGHKGSTSVVIRVPASEGRPRISLTPTLLFYAPPPFLSRREFAPEATPTNELCIDTQIKEKVSETDTFRPQVL